MGLRFSCELYVYKPKSIPVETPINASVQTISLPSSVACASAATLIFSISASRALNISSTSDLVRGSSLVELAGGVGSCGAAELHLPRFGLHADAESAPRLVGPSAMLPNRLDLQKADRVVM